MGPLSDVDRLTALREAEREADRIVRQAEAAARAMIDEAAADARRAVEERRERSERLAAERLEKESAAAREAARAFLEDAHRRTEEWSRRRDREIESVASALADRILPP